MGFIRKTRFWNIIKALRARIDPNLRIYPPIKPFSSCHLSVGAGHEIYIEQCGNKKGIPVIFLHGGPGAGCNPFNRRFFDPDLYHIVLFDQRGAGRSKPYASIDDNTTQDLVSDIEEIRKFLGVQAFLLFGGSWGSTLALVYAQAFPEHVLGIIVRGIFLCRPREINWFYQDGASRIFPDYWDEFCSIVPPDERVDMLSAYYRLLTNEDEKIRLSAAKAWSIWEGRASTLLPSSGQATYFSDPSVALCMSRIECHYFVNQGFLEENQLIRDAPRLKGIPGTIVHGRYDMICPVENAWELSRAWPESKLQIVQNAGHSAVEPGIRSALISATKQFARSG